VIRGVALSLLLAATCHAAEPGRLLTLEERDLDGKTQAVRQLGIVDINSRVTIRIDKEALRAQLRVNHRGADTLARDIDMVRQIQQQVAAGLEALPQMQRLLSQGTDLKKNPEAQAAVDRAIGRVADAADGILSYARTRAPALRADINRRIQSMPPMTEPYTVVFDAAAAYVKQLSADVDRRVAQDGVYVQLGAWVDTAGGVFPIHLPGFDSIPEREFVEIKRWQLAALLSPETKAQFEAAKKAADEINSGQKDAAAVLWEQVPRALVNALARQNACVKALGDPLQDLQKAGDGALAQVRALMNEAEAEVRGYVTYLEGLHRRYEALGVSAIGDLAGLYTTAREDLDELKRRTAALQLRFVTLQKQLTAIAKSLSANTQKTAQAIESKAGECSQQVELDLKALSTTVNLLVNGREIGAGSFEFSDKVLKHDLDSLPELTELDLRRTGSRDAGDGVIIRLGAGTAERGGRTLEDYRLRMYKVLTHVDVAVSLIFADPKKDFGLGSQFQAAPSYSVLLKWGRRDSTFWNELLRPGIGLNIAALDFNRDESLEIGLGLAVSAFRDYLQLGYGYNLNTSSGYWFIGLKFPLPGNTGGIDTKP
jgi:hypothetical protein